MAGLAALPLLGAACTLSLPSPPPLESIQPAAAGESHAASAVAPSDSAEQPESNLATTSAAEAGPELVDAWTMASREDGTACLATLESAGFKFQAYPAKSAPDKNGCGIPHAVVVFRGPTGITYDPPINVDCALARALGSVEQIVQEEAERHFHSKIVRIGNLGGFACRPRNYRKGASLSAHAFGSAVDLSSFQARTGQPAIVARDWPEAPRSSAAQENRRRFLRSVYGRLRAHEADLTYIVGPDFNQMHHNHFHLDRGGWHFWFNR